MRKTLVLIPFILVFGSCASVQEVRDGQPWSEPKDQALVIAQISDAHWVPQSPFWAEAVELLKRQSPEVLVFTGDQLDRIEFLDSWGRALEALDFIPHKIAIFGNNDRRLGLDPEVWKAFYQSKGIKFLVSESAEIPWPPGTLRIWGQDSLSGGWTLPLREGNPGLYLIHEPEIYQRWRAGERGLRGVVLAGHTHGGQITFLGLPLVLPSGSGPYVAGWYHRDSSLPLYVSRGLGVNPRIPFRLWAPSEVLFLRLQPPQAPQPDP